MQTSQLEYDDMTEHMGVREAVDGDVDAIVRLWQAAGVSRPWNNPQVDIAFARRDNHSTILVGLVGGRLVATAMIGEDGHRGWAYYVATDPDMREQGLGREIMDAAEQWLAARGVWKVQLLVREDNAQAIAFYDRLGYKDTRTTCLQKVLDDNPSI